MGLHQIYSGNLQKSSLAHQPVILMRPGAANDRLAQALLADGVEAWRWPAFTITLPDDEAIVADRFAHLDDVDMVILPCRLRWRRRRIGCGEWPVQQITLATVGGGLPELCVLRGGIQSSSYFPLGMREHSGSEGCLLSSPRLGHLAEC